MLQFLLSNGETISQISDLIGSKWAEILGWISIPTVATALLTCVFKLIITCISKKIASKNIKPLAQKVEEAKDTLLETTNKVEKMFDEKIQTYTNLVESKITECMNKYTQQKQVAFNKIINGEKEIQELLENVEEKVVVVENFAEKVQEAKTFEETKEIIEPVIEEIQKEIKPIIEEKKEDATEDENDPMLR